MEDFFDMVPSEDERDVEGALHIIKSEYANNVIKLLESLPKEHRRYAYRCALDVSLALAGETARARVRHSYEQPRRTR